MNLESNNRSLTIRRMRDAVVVVAAAVAEVPSVADDDVAVV